MLYPETHRESSMRNDERLLIGELAQHTGVNRETLRYYRRALPASQSLLTLRHPNR